MQHWFTQGGALEKLFDMLDDADATCRVKALLALSGMVRHYGPGLAALRALGGFEKVAALVAAPDARLQLKAMRLFKYLLSKVRHGGQLLHCMSLFAGSSFVLV